MFHRPNTAEDKNKTEQTVSVKQEQKSPVQQSANVQEKKEERTMSDNQTTSQNSQQGAEATTENSAPQENMNLYQRAPAAAMQSPSAPRMPGAYPGVAGQQAAKSVYSGSERSGVSVSSSSDRKLVIGPGITMSGEIESCDTLIVEGTVEAALKGAQILDIAQTGTFYGSVEIEEAMISGRFEGDITVTGRLTVASTGSITGTIVYGELAIEAGASIDGRMSPLANAGVVAGEKPRSKASPAKNDNVTDEAELPFSGHSSVAAAE